MTWMSSYPVLFVFDVVTIDCLEKLAVVSLLEQQVSFVNFAAIGTGTIGDVDIRLLR